MSAVIDQVSRQVHIGENSISGICGLDDLHESARSRLEATDGLRPDLIIISNDGHLVFAGAAIKQIYGILQGLDPGQLPIGREVTA